MNIKIATYNMTYLQDYKIRGQILFFIDQSEWHGVC